MSEEELTRGIMQKSHQGTKTYHRKNLLSELKIFTVKNTIYACFLTHILSLDVLNFRWTKGACSVISFNSACAHKQGLSAAIGNKDQCHIDVVLSIDLIQ